MAKTVRDIVMSRQQVFSISTEASVADAARYLKERHIRTAGVCNSVGKIVGVVSHSDISERVVAENLPPSELKVQAIATVNLIKVTPDTDCQDAARIMNENGIYHLLVEEANGEFLGMVSLRDCTNVRADEESERAAMYMQYAFPRY
ncbi:MAG TPA: CBS domain-containing protein [Blastocatellia bacterium]|nr:CBS domain-containing protein [Blastocatellia bacterium]